MRISDDGEVHKWIEVSLLGAAMSWDGSLTEMLETAAMSVRPDPPNANPMVAGRAMFVDMATEWTRLGRPRYVLSSTLASLLVSTKAPRVNDDNFKTPYDVFVVEVPGEWSSMFGFGPLQVLCARTTSDHDGDGMVVVAMRKHNQAQPPPGDNNVYVASMSGERELDETKLGINSVVRGTSAAPFTEAIRYLVNATLFVTAHQECSIVRAGKNSPRGSVIHDVRPPQNVSVTSSFRRHAQNLVANRRITERKEALMHIVRGHWKNQPTGKGRIDRSMIWVQPYQRGVDSLGRIVEKTIAVGHV